MNQDQAIIKPNLNPDLTPKIMIMGELLSQDEYDKSSDITEADINAIAEDWQSIAPDKFKNLLDAELD
jgi:hypothetical protein